MKNSYYCKRIINSHALYIHYWSILSRITKQNLPSQHFIFRKWLPCNSNDISSNANYRLQWPHILWITINNWLPVLVLQQVVAPVLGQLISRDSNGFNIHLGFFPRPKWKYTFSLHFKEISLSIQIQGVRYMVKKGQPVQTLQAYVKLLFFMK